MSRLQVSRKVLNEVCLRQWYVRSMKYKEKFKYLSSTRLLYPLSSHSMELLRRKSWLISLNCQTDRAHKEAGVEECTGSHQYYNFLPERWQHCQAEQWQPELWSFWAVSLTLHSNIHWSRLNRSTLNSTFFWAGPSTSIRISQGNLESGYRCEINIHAKTC